MVCLCGSEASSEKGHCLSSRQRLWECVLRNGGSAALGSLVECRWVRAEEAASLLRKTCVQGAEFLKGPPLPSEALRPQRSDCFHRCQASKMRVFCLWIVDKNVTWTFLFGDKSSVWPVVKGLAPSTALLSLRNLWGQFSELGLHIAALVVRFTGTRFTAGDPCQGTGQSA